MQCLQLGARLPDPLFSLFSGYERVEYILSNDSFHLIATSSSLKQGIQDIEEELAALWKEYVDADPVTLTQDALELRSKLTALFCAGR